MPHRFLWNYYYFADENLAHPGLSKETSCWRKSPPTWLVLAGYSDWPFLKDGVFLNKIIIPGLVAYFDNSAVYFKTF